MNNYILISKDVRLSFSLTAKSVYVTNSGELVLSIKQYGPNLVLPQFTVEYLEALCSKFYFGGYTHHHAIADILLLNGYIRIYNYGDFYNALRSNLEEQRVTVISSELSL